MQSLHPIDIFIIFAYLIVCLIIGFIASKKINNIKDYAIGGKYVNTALLIGTFIATEIGAAATVGVSEKVHSQGLVFAAGIMFQPFFWLIIAALLSKNIGYFKSLGCISLSDIMENLYGKSARWITNFLAIIISICILSLQITAIGYLCQYFLNISSEKCALIAFGVLVIYSFFGGIKAIIITDVLQAIIFIIGIPLACFIAFSKLNIPYNEIINNLPTTHTSIDFSFATIMLFMSLAFRSLSSLADGPLVQRYLMANNEQQLKKVMIRCFLISVPFTLIICCIGFIMKIAAPDINPNFTFFHLINEYLPIGIKGFLIAGLLAAIMSTADSWLNTASVICAHDIIKKVFPSIGSKLEVIIARISLLTISSIAAFMAINQNSSIYAPWVVINFWTPILLLPLCIGFLKIKVNSKSFIMGTLLAIICVLIGRFISGEFATISMLIGIIGSTLGLFGMHYWQRLKGIEMPNQIRTRAFTRPSMFKRINYILSQLRLRNLLKFSESFISENGRHYYVAGIVGWIILLLGMFFAGIGHSGITIAIYITAVIACCIIIVHECFLPINLLNRYLPLYFHLVLLVTFVLPAQYQLLLSNFNQLWLFNLVLCTLAVYLLANLRTVLILSAIGVAIALLFNITFKEAYMPEHEPTLFYFIILSSVMILIANNKEFFQKSILNRMDHYTKMMAHQMMQPVIQTSVTAYHIDDVLSKYKQPKIGENGQEYYILEKCDFHEVQNTLKSFKQTSKSSEHMVKGLLSMAKNEIQEAKDIDTYDIQKCLKEALLIYTSSALERIKVDKANSFKFKGSWLLITEVLRNIISNVFKHAGSETKIEIWCEGRSLHIKDNGIGISEERLNSLFDESSNKAGLGLAFCKHVIEAFNGKIECKSQQSKFTEFVLTFG